MIALNCNVEPWWRCKRGLVGIKNDIDVNRNRFLVNVESFFLSKF